MTLNVDFVEEFGEEEEDDGYFMYDFEDDAYVFPQNMDGSYSLKGTIQLQAELKYEQQVCNFGPEVAFLRLVANRTEDVKKKAIYKGLAWGLQFSSIESNMLSGIYCNQKLGFMNFSPTKNIWLFNTYSRATI